MSSRTCFDAVSVIASTRPADILCAAVREYAEAGYDRLFVSQMGPDADGFFDFFTRDVRPLLDDVLD